MHINLKNNPAKIYPDPIPNNGALGIFLKMSHHQEQQQEPEQDE